MEVRESREGFEGGRGGMEGREAKERQSTFASCHFYRWREGGREGGREGSLTNPRIHTHIQCKLGGHDLYQQGGKEGRQSY